MNIGRVHLPWILQVCMYLIWDSIPALTLMFNFSHRLLELLSRSCQFSYLLTIDTILPVSQKVMVILSRPLTVDSFLIVFLDVNLRLYSMIIFHPIFVILRDGSEVSISVNLLLRRAWFLLLIEKLSLIFSNLILES